MVPHAIAPTMTAPDGAHADLLPAGGRIFLADALPAAEEASRA